MNFISKFTDKNSLHCGMVYINNRSHFWGANIKDMKVKFQNKEQLFKATQAANGIVLPQSSLPILNNILVEAAGEHAVFMGCDNDSSVKCKIKAKVEEEGRITVPATPLVNLVRELPDSAAFEVQFALTDDGIVDVQSGTNEYHLQTMAPEDFPEWKDVEPLVSFEISQKELKELISKTIFAVPDKDPRKVLLGAYLTVDNNIPDFADVTGKESPCHLRMVATDGKILGYVDAIGTNRKGQESIGVVIPQKTMAELNKSLDGEGPVQVGIGERQIYFRINNTEFKTNKIDGEFPNYEMVIPQDFDHVITLDKQAFSKVIRRAAIVTEAQTSAIYFQFKTGELELDSRTFDLGSYKGNLYKPDIDYEGDPIGISFNQTYLMKAINVMETSKITMHVKSPSQPIIFHEEGHPETLFLVMPIKVTPQNE